MQTVYVDLLFFINFSMDLLCIFLASKILFRSLSLLRAFAAAAIGGFYSVFSLLIPITGGSAFIINILCCIIICLVAFSRKGDGFAILFANCFTYFLASILLGGIMTAAFNLLNNSGIALDGNNGSDIPPWLTLSVGIFSAITSYAGGRFIKRRSKKKTAKIKLTISGKELTLVGLYDSGNLLRDSISGTPVIVADEKHLEYFFGKKEKLNLNSLKRLSPSIAKTVVLIPYSTASGSKTMIAFRPQKLIISPCGKPKELNSLVGFANVKCAIDGCSALIPTELL